MGTFLADRHDGVPYFLQLSELLTAAEHLERNQVRSRNLTRCPYDLTP